MAQDKVLVKDGTVRECKVLGIEGDLIRVLLPPLVPGQSGAKTGLRCADVTKIIFGPDAILEALEQSPSAASIPGARAHWLSVEPFLGIPESHAGRVACAYGDALLLSGDVAKYEEALLLFRRVEAESWSQADRSRAARGRLAAMLKLGKIEDASREAEEMAKTAQDPGLLIQAKLLLARTHLASLRRLLEDNPRWDQDPPVRAERETLRNEGLDLALYPFLFHGTARPEAAEGLWIAHELHEASGDHRLSAETCRDITAIYPETPYAARAKEFLVSSGNHDSPAATQAPPKD